MRPAKRIKPKKRKMKRVLVMSRQDTNLLNPMFEIEQMVKESNIMYVRGFNMTAKKPKLNLYDLKAVIEKCLDLDDISKKTRKREYVDARNIYVKLAFGNISFNESKIMKVIKRHRSNFYNNKKTFDDLINVDAEFTEKFNHVLKFVEL